jgi:hypothetical protein
MRHWRKFTSLPSSTRILLCDALLTVVWVRIGLSIFHVPRLPKRAPIADQIVDPATIAWAVKTASRLVPRSVCLTEALAVQRLLAARGQGSSVHVGVNHVETVDKAGAEFQAHAWLEYNGSTLIGASATNYIRLLRFEVA